MFSWKNCLFQELRRIRMNLLNIPYVSTFENILVLRNVPIDLLAQITYPSLVKKGDGYYTADMGGITLEEEVKLLKMFNDLGFAFSIGGMGGWSPSELFEDYREKGLLSGTYKEIAWKGPDNWIIRER
jgi:hypothetical protein